MPRNIIALNAWAMLLVCACLSQANGQASRQPLGVYAHVVIEDLIKGYQGPQPVHIYLRHLYAQVLADPAISGLAVGEHWDHIQPSEDGYDWSYLDDAFAVANAANKSVQLLITPGFNSPAWLVHRIPPC